MFTLLADTIYQVHEVRGYGIGWMTLSLINAGLAQAKNRSGLNWWFGSLFIGPLATFLIVALDPLPAATRRVSETASK